MDRQIRVYNEQGELARVIGRRGEGPGELEALSYMGLLGDTVFVSDAALLRVSFFSPEGEFLTSIPLASPTVEGGLGPNVPDTFLSDGTALVWPALPLRSLASGGITEIPYLKITRDGAVLDTVAWLPVEPRTELIAIRGQQHYVLPPFRDSPLVVPLFDGSGLFLIERAVPQSTDDGVFKLHKIGPAGDTLFTKEHIYRAVPTPDWVVDSAAARIAEALARRSPPPSVTEVSRAIREAGLVPRSLVPITDVVPSQDGTLWVRREEREGSDANWNVLDRQGEIIAEVSLPKQIALLAATSDVLVGVEYDPFDVPYLVRFALLRN